jgi:hypothetical protein
MNEIYLRLMAQFNVHASRNKIIVSGGEFGQTSEVEF